MWDLEIWIFQPSKFLASGGLTSCVLMKEMPDPEWKGFNLKIFRLRRAHYINCLNKGNARFWNKMVSIYEIFRLRRGHINCLNKGNAKFWNKMVSTLEIFRLRRAQTCFQGSRVCQNSVEDCNLGPGFRVVEEPLISPMIGHYYWALKPLKGHCLIDKCERGAAKRRRVSYIWEKY